MAPTLAEDLRAADQAWRDSSGSTVAPTLRAIVGHAFCAPGQRPNRALVRAVREFVDKARLPSGRDDELTLSPLDLHTLQLIAAAGPLLDQNHLIALLQAAPVTGFGLRTVEVDAAQARADLTALLEPYTSARRLTVLRSLLEDGVLRDLDLSPPDLVRAAPLACALVRDRLVRDLEGRRHSARAAAISSRHLSPDLLPLALDAIEGTHGFQTRGVLRPLERLVAQDLSDVPVGQLARLIRVARDCEAYDHELHSLLHAIASNATTPPDLLDALAHRGLPNDAFASIRCTHDHGVEARLAVAQNPSCPSRALGELANDHAATVCDAAIAHPATPPEQIRDRPPQPPFSEDQLHAFARSWSSGMRMLAAVDEGTPEDVLRSLAQDADGRVVNAVAANQAAPPDLLVHIASPASDGRRPAALAAIANPAFPIERLRAVVGGNDAHRFVAAAKNPNLPVDLQWQLASSPFTAVQEALAKRTDLAAGTVAALFQSPVRAAHQMALEHPLLPPEIASELWSSAPDRQALFHNPAVRDGTIPIPPAIFRWLDGHEVRALATDPSPVFAPAAVQAQCSSLLDESSEALVKGIPLPARPRTWSELPSMMDVPFDLPIDPLFVEGAPVAGLRARVARRGRELIEAHEQMGNCLDGYVPRVRAGEAVVALIPDPARKNQYAAAWRVDVRSGTFHLVELNAKYNERAAVPNDLRAAIEDVTRSVSTALRAERHALDASGGLSHSSRRSSRAMCDGDGRAGAGPGQVERTPGSAAAQPATDRGRPGARAPRHRGRPHGGGMGVA